ncbi:MAG: MBL fold metallo-hydrolase [Bacteroidales bacterium]|jgi:glyoxylase-like metal-dependent hydrolase (beta-lactamase superfamily II)|nr:MBL fold metallo-hydrolase [Bacteroidales bacterium]MDD6184929.1 MBL fold metallo-hydrolase [Bacteroidales bacterium]
MEIKTFHFNPIMVNTYLLSDETGEAVIVDPGNCRSYEDEQIREYVSAKNLRVKYIINTHPHIDHIAGNPWCMAEYHPELLMHEAGMPIYNKAFAYAAAFGLETEKMPAPDRFLQEGDVVTFGNQKLKVLYTPGHCDGSICLYSADNKLIITGDLIFELSVGRSDLPTGNEALLQQSIREKILPLPDEVTILSGHGGPTTVGRERRGNPYLAQ